MSPAHPHEFIPPGTRFHALASPFPMKRGGVLHGARIAYETWGTLSPARDNAVLILTGLSPDAHAASSAADPTPGWWEAMLGPGKPIDSDRWFVVCVNSLGSCKGSTGPASIDPATGQPYLLSFPELSIEDIADAAAEVVRGLGIERLACVIGNSMGGMTALSLLARHRRIARKLGVITYRSALEWDGRFGRVRLDESASAEDDPFGLEFQVESYLEGHARRFVRRYDPNCYLYLSRSMDWFDLADQAGGDTLAALAALAGNGVERALAIGANTDILFPVQQQQEVADGLARGGAEAEFIGMDSPQGHDAFLVDFERFGPAVRDFLDRL